MVEVVVEDLPGPYPTPYRIHLPPTLSHQATDLLPIILNPILINGRINIHQHNILQQSQMFKGLLELLRGMGFSDDTALD